VWLAGLLAAWLVLGVAVYAALISRVSREGGRVSAAEFGPLDFGVSSVLMLWFAMAISGGINAPERTLKIADLVHGGAFLVLMLLFVFGFLSFHGIHPIRQFGLNRLNPFLCLLLALGLLISAYPFMMLAARAAELILHGKAQAQNVVEFFRNALAGSDRRAIYLTIFIGVIIAPAAEEAVFRGFLYGVLKRYLGPLAAAVVSAAFFTAMHLNAGSLLPLFVLALCFTLAYEATGSLLVNIFMHALFNLSTFLFMLAISHRLVTT